MFLNYCSHFCPTREQMERWLITGTEELTEPVVEEDPSSNLQKKYLVY